MTTHVGVLSQLGSLKKKKTINRIQGGAPKLCLLVYNPMKTIDISPTKTIVIGVVNQLSYRTGAPPCIIWLMVIYNGYLLYI